MRSNNSKLRAPAGSSSSSSSSSSSKLKTDARVKKEKETTKPATAAATRARTPTKQKKQQQQPEKIEKTTATASASRLPRPVFASRGGDLGAQDNNDADGEGRRRQDADVPRRARTADSNDIYGGKRSNPKPARRLPQSAGRNMDLSDTIADNQKQVTDILDLIAAKDADATAVVRILEPSPP